MKMISDGKKKIMGKQLYRVAMGRPMGLRKAFLTLIFLFLPAVVFATHPLITDDAGTEGKGEVSMEFNAEYGHEEEEGITEKETEVAVEIAYGAFDTVDVVLEAPYMFVSVENGESESESGIGDLELWLKWRFFEREGLSLAVKPGLTIPTGDEEKEFGTGKVGGSVFLIGTEEMEPVMLHLNLGYIRNENDEDDNTDLWHASLAAEMEVVESLTAVANVGIERNLEEESDEHPAFIIGGLVYEVSENLSVDIGFKGGLTEPETDYAALAGIEVEF